jgi:acyl carrier protein
MQIWKKVLRVKDIGIKDNFFEWGGDSLKAAEVLAQVEAKFRQNLPLPALLENPVVVNK